MRAAFAKHSHFKFFIRKGVVTTNYAKHSHFNLFIRKGVVTTNYAKHSHFKFFIRKGVVTAYYEIIVNIVYILSQKCAYRLSKPSVIM